MLLHTIYFYLYPNIRRRKYKILITKEVEIRLNSSNIKHYENAGYDIPREKDKRGRLKVAMKIKLLVKVEDLPSFSHTLVNIECDGCGKLLEGVQWGNYKTYVKEDGKYYCKKCGISSFEKWVSFYEWCYNNLSKEDADKILERWDYDLNIDKHGKQINPKDISIGSLGFNNKGYWFKCLNNSKHCSELKSIHNFIRGHDRSIKCNKCSTISITHPHLVKFLTNKKDAEKYSYTSNENIPMFCQDCGHKKLMSISHLLRKNFSCNICSDKFPYPEKFFANFLIQLSNSEFSIQSTNRILKWCKNYRYDFYIKRLNCIIETHGLQHYKEVKSWDKLNKVQKNDKAKELLAKENGINNYIILDCRNSDMKWIKDSIMKSKLPELLNFKEDDIDWLQCHEAGCKNLVKEVCDNWSNKNNIVRKIADELKISVDTVRKYLKQGTELGWCAPPYTF